MKKLLLLLILTFYTIVSCTRDNSPVRYTIASKSANCIGVGPQKCLLVKINSAKSWEYFYNQIEGFEYEEGFEYVLDVSEEKVANPPADGSSIRYVLIKEIAKKKTISQELPPTVF